MKKRTGKIYRIVNQQNNKVYVGKTTLDVDARWHKHKLNSERGQKSKLYNAIRCYGQNNFLVETILSTPDMELSNLNQHLNVLERIFIIIFDSYRNGYNMTTGGDGAAGRTHSRLSRQKMSKSHIGKTPWNKNKKCSSISGENHWIYGRTHSIESRKKQSTPILQFTINGEYLNSYWGINRASEITNIGRSNISACLRGKSNTAGGFIWKYLR